MKRAIYSKAAFGLLVLLYSIASVYNVTTFHSQNAVPVRHPPFSGPNFESMPRRQYGKSNSYTRPFKTENVRGTIPKPFIERKVWMPLNQKQYNNLTADDSSLLLDNLSSVDYYACCGLGHRLIRMASAYFVAKKFNFSFRSFWGYCGATETFSHLFRPYKASEMVSVTSYNHVLPVYFDVKPGFQTLQRRNYTNTPNKCQCHKEEIESDLEFYSSLRERFRGASVVKRFVQEHFANHTVLGIHVRAGNGETGDFEKKGRGILEPTKWVQQVVNQLQVFLSKQTLTRPPLVYIATDTPSMIELFRQKLQQYDNAKDKQVVIPIMHFEQTRVDEGRGVLFGEIKHNSLQDDSCLQAWFDALVDMFILSHSDVVITGKSSTFVQSAPMSLAMAQANPKLAKTYCEVDPVSVVDPKTEALVVVDQKLHCYSSYMDWCCRAPKRTREMLIVWDPDVTTEQLAFRLRTRKVDCHRPPPNARRFTRYCLPHTWRNDVIDE